MGYKKGRLQKRWYIDATVGKNVPIIGGTGLKMGTGTLTKRGLDSHIKQVVKRQVLEPKLHRSNLVTSPTALHNGLLTWNIFSQIVNGTDEEHRIGDTIGVKGVSIKLNLQGASAGTSDRIHYRILVVKTKVSDTTAGIISAHLGYTDIFWGSSTNMLIAPVCYNQCSTLYDQTFRMDPSYSGQKINRVVDVKFKPPGTFKYDEVNTNKGKFFNYYLVVVPYIERGTEGVTAVGDFTLQQCISFVDSK